MPIVTLQVYDRLLKNQSVETAFVLVGGAAIAIMMESFLRYGRSYLLSRYSVGFETTAEKHFMRRFLSLNHGSKNKMGAAEIIENQGDLAVLKNHYMGQTIIALFDLPFTLFYLVVIWYIGGEIIFVPLAIIVVLLLLAVWLRSISAELIMKKDHDHIKILTHLYNIFCDAKKLKLNANASTKSTTELADKAQNSRLKLGNLNFLAAGITITLSQLTTVLVVMFGAILVIHGDMTTGALAALTILGGRCISPISRLISHNIGLETISIAINRMTAIENADIPVQFSQKETIEVLEGQTLTLENATIVYENKTLVFDLKLVPGVKYCLEDQSENQFYSHALMALLSVDVSLISGKFTVGNLAQMEFSRDDYYQSVAYVPANVILFPGSLLQNLTNFKDELADEAFNLCKVFNLHDGFERLSSGYKTNIIVAEYPAFNRGTIQLIGLIRALLHNPKILLLDNMDAGLDQQHQDMLIAYLNSQIELTIVAIAATSTLKLNLELFDMDLILKEGDIA